MILSTFICIIFWLTYEIVGSLHLLSTIRFLHMVLDLLLVFSTRGDTIIIINFDSIFTSHVLCFHVSIFNILTWLTIIYSIWIIEVISLWTVCFILLLLVAKELNRILLIDRFLKRFKLFNTLACLLVLLLLVVEQFLPLNLKIVLSFLLFE